MAANDKNKQHERVSNFYDEKSLFITGASGFLGTVILEILLRCIPGIKSIFILVRTKKGVDPEGRKKLIFQKKIFRKLLEENPNAPEKVIVVAGDITQHNLGMSDDDYHKIRNEVTIIFHIAATISFLKPLRYIAMHNCLSVKYIIELARKLRKLDALVYTSTAFSNSNRPPEIEEIVYRLPWSAQRFLKALECGEKDEFEKLAAGCLPPWPNNYTFCKCLAENMIADMVPDLPGVIVRPSIISPAWGGPVRGYAEEGVAVVDLPMAVGKGFARVIRGDYNSRFDIVPVDIVANAHIVAAWCVATERLPPTSVINCTGGPWYVTFGLFSTTLTDLAFKWLIPKTFQKPSVIFVKNLYAYKLWTLYEHYIPAYVLDVFLALKGSKLRLVKLYKFLDQLMDQLNFFLQNTFNMRMENFNKLTEELDPRDKEIFSMDLESIDMVELVQAIPSANSFFDWEIADKLSPEKRKQIVLRRTVTIYFIKSVTLLLLGYILYRCLYLLFSLIL